MTRPALRRNIRSGRFFAAALLFLCGAGAVPARAQIKLIKDIKQGIRQKLSPNAEFFSRHFRCVIPKSWQVKKDQDSLFLAGPNEDAILPPKIAVDYYEAGNPSFKDADDYLATNRDGGIPLKGEKTGPVEKMRVASLPAKGFFRDTFEYVTPNSLNPVKVPVREEYIVVAQDKGFFVFMYSTPAMTFRRYYPNFQKVVDSFRPLP